MTHIILFIIVTLFLTSKLVSNYFKEGVIIRSTKEIFIFEQRGYILLINKKEIICFSN